MAFLTILVSIQDCELTDQISDKSSIVEFVSPKHTAVTSGRLSGITDLCVRDFPHHPGMYMNASSVS